MFETVWTRELGWFGRLRPRSPTAPTSPEFSEAIGGNAEALTTAIDGAYREGWDLRTAVREAVAALRTAEGREVEPAAIEAGILDRTRGSRRTFRRLDVDEVASILAD